MAISGVSGVVAPRIATFSPAISSTTCSSASPASMLSPDTSTLPAITGNSTVSMNFASGSGPRSNSWLPKTMASKPMRFIISASAWPE